MITVNSLQLLLVPVAIILAGRYYLEYLVDIDNLFVFPTNQSLPEQLTDDWAENERLSSAQPLYTGQPPVHGVESAAEFNGHLYGTDDQNRILEFNLANGKIRFLGEVSGRVLGVRVDSKGQMFYMQANKGLFRLDTTSKQSNPEPVYIHDPVNEPENIRNVTFLNDFVFQERPDGQHLFYITQSTRRWPLNEITSFVLENDKTGRVLIFDAATKELSVLADKMHFPNGVELLQDQSALLVSEFTQRRIRRIPLKGEGRGQLKTFFDILPGEPDNIRRSLTNTYWIAFDGIRNSTDCHIMDRHPESRLIRQGLLYVHRAMEVTLDLLNAILDTSGWQKQWAAYALESQKRYMTRGATIEVDAEGNLLTVLQSSKVRLLSEVREIKSDQPGKRLLFLGSYFKFPPMKLYL